ncbi:MAG: hypothetical protein JF614_04640 [Acidobacteria bacterium]|nr:hypothetical protein [Acidobacteriota bacterium]
MRPRSAGLRSFAGRWFLLLLAVVGGGVYTARAQAPRPGTGYDARGRGLTQSHYLLYNEGVLRNLANGKTVVCRPCEPSCSCPDDGECVKTYREGPTVTRPINFAVTDISTTDGFNARYGLPQPNLQPCPDPGASKRWKWQPIDNEQKFVYQEAIEDACRNAPEMIGSQGAAGGWDCHITQRELNDAAATGDVGILRWWAARQVGGSPENRISIPSPGRACTWEEPNLLIPGAFLFYANAAPCGGGGPASPPTPIDCQPPLPAPALPATPANLPVCADGGPDGATPGTVVYPVQAKGWLPEWYYRPGLQSTGQLNLKLVVETPCKVPDRRP